MITRGFYRHWKGGVYFVHGIADLEIDGTVGRAIVVYESIQGVNDDGRMRARSRTDFDALVQDGDGRTVPRFTRIESW